MFGVWMLSNGCVGDVCCDVLDCVCVHVVLCGVRDMVWGCCWCVRCVMCNICVWFRTCGVMCCGVGIAGYGVVGNVRSASLASDSVHVVVDVVCVMVWGYCDCEVVLFANSDCDVVGVVVVWVMSCVQLLLMFIAYMLCCELCVL